MATFLEMRSRIADELANDGDLTVNQINNAIRDAIAAYEGEAFWFNQKVATMQAVAGQELYGSTNLADIPNMVSVVAMRLYGSDVENYLINGINNEAIEDVQDGSVTGDPTLYSRFENKIRLYPIPARTRTVRISYITKFPMLSADTDSNAWTEECEELIRQAAKKRLCLDILLADDMAARCAALEKEAYDGIRMENRLRSPQQTLRADLPFGRRHYGLSGWRG